MNKAERLSISWAVQQELEKTPKIKVLLYLQDHGETSAYRIAKLFGWEPSKAHAVIKQLERSKSIKTEAKIINGRAVKLVKLAGG